MTKRIIKLKIHDESEFFSPMDPDRNMVSDEVIDYLSRVFSTNTDGSGRIMRSGSSARPRSMRST